MAENCPEPQIDCPYRGTENCMVTKHHMYWPRNEYTTDVERRFRGLPQNLVRVEWCKHRELHYEDPPPKPSLEVMAQAIREQRRRR